MQSVTVMKRNAALSLAVAAYSMHEMGQRVWKSGASYSLNSPMRTWSAVSRPNWRHQMDEMDEVDHHSVQDQEIPVSCLVMLYAMTCYQVHSRVS